MHNKAYTIFLLGISLVIGLLALSSCSSNNNPVFKEYRSDIGNFYKEIGAQDTDRAVAPKIQSKKITRKASISTPNRIDTWLTPFGNISNSGGHIRVKSTSFKSRLYLTSDTPEWVNIISNGGYLLLGTNQEVIVFKSYSGQPSVVSQVYLPYIGCKYSYAISFLEREPVTLCAASDGSQAKLYMINSYNQLNAINDDIAKDVPDIMTSTALVPHTGGVLFIAKNGIKYARPVMKGKDIVIQDIDSKEIHYGFSSYGTDVYKWSISANNVNDLFFTYGNTNEVIIRVDNQYKRSQVFYTGKKSGNYYVNDNLPHGIAIDNNDMYYFNSYGLVSVHIPTAKLQMTVENITSSVPPVVTDKYLYIYNSADNRVIAIARSSGDVIWRSDYVIDAHVSHFLFANGKIVIPDNKNLNMVYINATTGRTDRTEKMHDMMIGNFAVFNDHIHYFDRSGHLNSTAK